jgi:integrase
MLSTGKIKALAPPERGSRIVYDHKPGDNPAKVVRGFGARITAAGAIAFVLTYRIDGIERRMTIGAFPTWSVVQAREEARRLRREIDKGADPLEERTLKRLAPTVRDLWKRFDEEILPGNRPGTGREYRSMWRQWVEPAIGSLKVADVRPSQIEDLHRQITRSGAPVRANRTVTLCSRLFSLAVRWEFRETNPCRSAVERNREQARKRYLTPGELVRLSEALAECRSQSAANAIRLALLTGSRRSEIAAAKWSEFDLEAAIWVKPHTATKQKSDHHVPLSAPALELLTKMRAAATSGYPYWGSWGLC